MISAADETAVDRRRICDSNRDTSKAEAEMTNPTYSPFPSRSSRLAVSDLLAGPCKREGNGSENQSPTLADPSRGDRKPHPDSESTLTKSLDASANQQRLESHRHDSDSPSWDPQRETRPSAKSTSAPQPTSAREPSRHSSQGTQPSLQSEFGPSGLGDGVTAYQYAAVQQITEQRENIEYILTIREQPKHSRMCGVGEKADRRPIDPAPIIQLRVVTHDHAEPKGKSRSGDDEKGNKPASSEVQPLKEARSSIVNTTLGRSGKDVVLRRGVPVRTDWGEGWEDKTWYLENPYYFMYAMLADAETDEELHLLGDGKTRYTTGSCVSCLYHLKDIDGSEQGFFVFPDLSIRVEGRYRLKLCLFETIGHEVHHCKSVYSTPFNVYTAKRFPGMEESTMLSKTFADQGLKVRVRKNPRARRQRGGVQASKRKGTLQSDDESEGEGYRQSSMPGVTRSPSSKRVKNVTYEYGFADSARAQQEQIARELAEQERLQSQAWHRPLTGREDHYGRSSYGPDSGSRTHGAVQRLPQYERREAATSHPPALIRPPYDRVGSREDRGALYGVRSPEQESSMGGAPSLPAIRREYPAEVREPFPAPPLRRAESYREMREYYDGAREYSMPRREYLGDRPRHYDAVPHPQSSRGRDYAPFDINTRFDGQNLPVQRHRSPTGPSSAYSSMHRDVHPQGYYSGTPRPLSPPKYVDARDRSVSDPYTASYAPYESRYDPRIVETRHDSQQRLPPMHMAFASEASSRDSMTQRGRITPLVPSPTTRGPPLPPPGRSPTLIRSHSGSMPPPPPSASHSHRMSEHGPGFAYAGPASLASLPPPPSPHGSQGHVPQFASERSPPRHSRFLHPHGQPPLPPDEAEPHSGMPVRGASRTSMLSPTIRSPHHSSSLPPPQYPPGSYRRP